MRKTDTAKSRSDDVRPVFFEFIKVSADVRQTVIYPMGADGKADLTKGIDIKTEGSLVWTKYVNADGGLIGDAACFRR